MALLSPIIGAEKTGEFFLDKYLELCTNENYDIRKMCAVYCPHLCKVMGVEISERYLVCIYCSIINFGKFEVIFLLLQFDYLTDSSFS